MSREILLKQQINIIFYYVDFLFFHHGGFLWRARVIFLKRDKLETKTILGPRQGHALKNDQEKPALIPLIQIIFGTKLERRYNK
jgi:hypothetical protein